MSAFRVNVIAANIADQQQVTAPVNALVDTGLELTWLPGDVLRTAGIKPLRSSSFETATGRVVSRQTGYAILRSEGYETIDEVVFGEPGDSSLLAFERSKDLV